MEVRLLGEVAFSVGGADLPVKGVKQRRLLTVLALRPGQVVMMDRLVEIVWGEATPTHPANALQAQVSALRRVLPEGRLVTKAGGYALDVDPSAVDVTRFERLVSEGRHLLAAGDAAAAATALGAALGLWGPPLGDLADGDRFRAEVAWLEELHLAALEARADAELALGEHQGLVAELEALTARYPLRERFWVQLMVALYRCGRQSDALRAFAQVRTQLLDGLGLEPGAELRRTEALILAQDPSLDPPATAAAAPGPNRSPALGPMELGNLRARLTTFVGRAADLARVAVELDRSRLVTLVGPGGVGKTRLAIEFADRYRARLPDGVWLVELAALDDVAGVASAISSALGATEADRAASGEAPAYALDRLIVALSGRALLLIVDNCEHIIAEVAEVCQELVTRLPGLQVLATSREPLLVPGEVVVPVSPLEPAEAAELFRDRARTPPIVPTTGDDRMAGFIGEICARLDYLPLAIELAAARSRSLSLADLAGRLDHRFALLTGGARTAPTRQQTLRAVVDWSYDLLFEDEQRLFARLSIFADACRLEAVEQVCADDELPAGDIVDLIGRLVDKSLLEVEPGADGEVRYRQLQTLRHYGRDRLRERGERYHFAERHARWFLAEARAASSGLAGGGGLAWRRRLENEVNDLRAALDWYVSRGESEPACQLTTGMAFWWFLRAEWHEAVRWLDLALGVPNGTNTIGTALARQWRAYFASFFDPSPETHHMGRVANSAIEALGAPEQRGEAGLLYASTLNKLYHYPEALEVLDRAGPALAVAGNEWGQAMRDLLAATAHLRLDQLEEAENAARRSLERFKGLGEHFAILEPMDTLAELAIVRGDLATARDRYDELIALSRQRELSQYLVRALISRGVLALRAGDAGAAAGDFLEAGQASRHPINTAIALVGQARAHAHQGDPNSGVTLLDRARTLFEAAGHGYGQAVVEVAVGLAELELDQPDRAADRAERVCALNPTVGSVLAAAVAATRGDHQRQASHHRRWEAAEHDQEARLGLLAQLLSAENTRLSTGAAGH